MKPSERILEITNIFCEENPDVVRLSCHLWAIEEYLDEQYENDIIARQELKDKLVDL